ncbi:hypothetical protein BC835DRAFT_1397953 [Cytidiella melzeri]|nr:hypothetical protein BC835DRAFT_1397953 [Cytidiella melzeri]
MSSSSCKLMPDIVFLVFNNGVCTHEQYSRHPESPNLTSMGDSDYSNAQPFISGSPSHDADGQPSSTVVGGPGTAGGGPTTPVGTPTENVPFASGSSTPIHVSNTFNLNARLDGLQPDVVVISIDKIFFAVHYHKLITSSFNNFNGLLPPNANPSPNIPLMSIVPDHSSVINIALHCIYELPCDKYNNPFEVLAASLPVLSKYGLPPSRYLARGTPLYNTILNHALMRPIDTYALAASNGLEDLAVAASAYTLHLKLHHMPQQSADKMGTLYLQRLYHLHLSRMDRLKELLDAKLFPHVAKPHCSVEQRQVVSRAYQLAGAQVFYSATPADSTPRM